MINRVNSMRCILFSINNALVFYTRVSKVITNKLTT